jgi:hypothetical protein
MWIFIPPHGEKKTSRLQNVLFFTKHKVDGNIKIYKETLVIKEYTQTYDIKY